MGVMDRYDVLVVGGGPSGAACAYWLADAGHDVLLLEKKRYPREKTCGPATWWWPTAPTPASDVRWVRRATAITRSAWPSGGTSSRPATTSRGSRAISTSATRRGTCCPATAGSSRSATAG